MSQLIIYDTASIVGDISKLTPDTGTDPVVPTAGGNVTIAGGNGLTTTGGLNTLTIDIDAAVSTSNTVQTADATATTLFSFTLAASEAIAVRALVLGAKSDYSAVVGGIIMGIARRGAAGGAVLVTSSPLLTVEDSGTGNPAFVFDVSGNDIRLRVTGEAGVTYNWSSNVQYLFETT